LNPKVEQPASIAKLMALGKLADQTKKNYTIRVMSYLREIGKSPDEFVNDVRRHPKKFEADFIEFLQKMPLARLPLR
jgi:hypothetical protein